MNNPISQEVSSQITALYRAVISDEESNSYHEACKKYRDEVAVYAAKQDPTADEKEEFYKTFVLENRNGIATIKQAWIGKGKTGRKPSAVDLEPVFGDLVSLATKKGSVPFVDIEEIVDQTWEKFRTITKAVTECEVPSIFNRAVASVLGEYVSVCPTRDHFFRVYDWFVDNKFLQKDWKNKSDRDWFRYNVKLMKFLADCLTDVEDVDCHYIGIFVRKMYDCIDKGSISDLVRQAGIQKMNQKESNLPSTSSAPEIGRPRNWLLFGAPGTGKSFKINKEACRHENDVGMYEAGLFEDAEGRDPHYERVTFYPTYSYAQFVGTYKPVMKPVAEGSSKEEISYEFVPGPFLRVLVNALNDEENRCLIIEEINRANAAAVFGDVFQLLDRNSKGESEYSIAVSEDVKRYLANELGELGKEALKNLTGTEDMSRIRIPRNMYLWATMNSADQGVFPMDTAFKRRWEFEYMDINNGDNYCEGWKVKNDSGEEYKWNALRKFLNRLLELNGVNEDKLMGPFFVRAKDNQIDLKQFTSKVLMYLWEDAARMCRAKIFVDDIRSYSRLVDKWKEQGLEIFEAAKQKANDKDLNSLSQSALPKSGDSNGGSISSDSVGAGENGSQG